MLLLLERERAFISLSAKHFSESLRYLIIIAGMLLNFVILINLEPLFNFDIATE